MPSNQASFSKFVRLRLLNPSQSCTARIQTAAQNLDPEINSEDCWSEFSNVIFFSDDSGVQEACLFYLIIKRVIEERNTLVQCFRGNQDSKLCFLGKCFNFQQRYDLGAANVLSLSCVILVMLNPCPADMRKRKKTVIL